jgi:hypothetical protein
LTLVAEGVAIRESRIATIPIHTNSLHELGLDFGGVRVRRSQIGVLDSQKSVRFSAFAAARKLLPSFLSLYARSCVPVFLIASFCQHIAE